MPDARIRAGDVRGDGGSGAQSQIRRALKDLVLVEQGRVMKRSLFFHSQRVYKGFVFPGGVEGEAEGHQGGLRPVCTHLQRG